MKNISRIALLAAFSTLCALGQEASLSAAARARSQAGEGRRARPRIRVAASETSHGEVAYGKTGVTWSRFNEAIDDLAALAEQKQWRKSRGRGRFDLRRRAHGDAIAILQWVYYRMSKLGFNALSHEELSRMAQGLELAISTAGRTKLRKPNPQLAKERLGLVRAALARARREPMPGPVKRIQPSRKPTPVPQGIIEGKELAAQFARIRARQAQWLLKHQVTQASFLPLHLQQIRTFYAEINPFQELDGYEAHAQLLRAHHDAIQAQETRRTQAGGLGVTAEPLPPIVIPSPMPQPKPRPEPSTLQEQERLRRERQAREVAAATDIQAAFRGFLARREVAPQLREYRDLQEGLRELDKATMRFAQGLQIGTGQYTNDPERLAGAIAEADRLAYRYGQFLATTTLAAQRAEIEDRIEKFDRVRDFVENLFTTALEGRYGAQIDRIERIFRTLSPRDRENITPLQDLLQDIRATVLIPLVPFIRLVEKQEAIYGRVADRVRRLLQQALNLDFTIKERLIALGEQNPSERELILELLPVWLDVLKQEPYARDFRIEQRKESLQRVFPERLGKTTAASLVPKVQPSEQDGGVPISTPKHRKRRRVRIRSKWEKFLDRDIEEELRRVQGNPQAVIRLLKGYLEGLLPLAISLAVRAEQPLWQASAGRLYRQYLDRAAWATSVLYHRGYHAILEPLSSEESHARALLEREVRKMSREFEPLSRFIRGGAALPTQDDLTRMEALLERLTDLSLRARGYVDQVELARVGLQQQRAKLVEFIKEAPGANLDTIIGEYQSDLTWFIPDIVLPWLTKMQRLIEGPLAALQKYLEGPQVQALREQEAAALTIQRAYRRSTERARQQIAERPEVQASLQQYENYFTDFDRLREREGELRGDPEGLYDIITPLFDRGVILLAGLSAEQQGTDPKLAGLYDEHREHLIGALLWLGKYFRDHRGTEKLRREEDEIFRAFQGAAMEIAMEQDASRGRVRSLLDAHREELEAFARFRHLAGLIKEQLEHYAEQLASVSHIQEELEILRGQLASEANNLGATTLRRISRDEEVTDYDAAKEVISTRFPDLQLP